MTITNTLKPNTSIVNTTKVSHGETWATDLNAWSAESRTWLATNSLFTNISKQSSSITNTNKP